MTRAAIRRLTALAMIGLVLAPERPGAHPHVFIDAGLRLIMEEGAVAAVEVTWLYDEFYTLVLLEDFDLDADFDMALTPEEVEATLGFDLNWNSGFDGALRITRDGVDLEIGAPEPVSLEMIAPGRIRTTHRRPVTDPGGAGPVVASAYDEAFYVAIEMIGSMEVSGATCENELIRADLDSAYDALEAALEEIGGAVAAEDNFPAIGALFADRVEFRCAD